MLAYLCRYTPSVLSSAHAWLGSLSHVPPLNIKKLYTNHKFPEYRMAWNALKCKIGGRSGNIKERKNITGMKREIEE